MDGGGDGTQGFTLSPCRCITLEPKTLAANEGYHY